MCHQLCTTHTPPGLHMAAQHWNRPETCANVTTVAGNHDGKHARPAALTVRLSEPMHQLVVEEAELAGVSANQFIREATLLRVGWGRGRRGEPLIPLDDLRTVRRLLEQLEQG